MKSKIKQLMGIIPSKICVVTVNDIISNTDWVKKLYHCYRMVLTVFPRYPFPLFFREYVKLITDFCSQSNDNKMSIKNHLIMLYKNSDDAFKLFIYCVLCQTKLLDNDSIEFMLFDLTQKHDNAFRYWLSIDISYSTFGNGVDLYSDYFLNRKKVFQKIAEDSQIQIPSKKKINEKRIRICVLSYQLNPDMHNSAQRVCAMIANNLNCFADEVMVLCLDTTYKSVNECRNYITNIRTPRSDKYIEGIKKHFDEGIIVRVAHGKNFEERAQNYLDILYNYSPKIIIDMCDDYSPFSYIYSRDFFTVFEPMRVGVSSQFFDKIIATKGKYAAVHEKFNHVLSDNKALYWAFPEYVPKKIKDITKTELGISEDSFVVVTIGNNGVIEKDLIENMKHLLESDIKVFWLIVGNIALEYLNNCCKTLIDNRRIIVWGHEKNLIGLCTACDVVLRYNTTGGSGGTAIAAMQGLPVVMTNKICDASRWLGLDYSDITDEKGLIDEIKRLKSDRQYYLERQAKVRELIGKAVDSKEKWKELYDLLIKAEQEWRNHKNEQ